MKYTVRFVIEVEGPEDGLDGATDVYAIPHLFDLHALSEDAVEVEVKVNGKHHTTLPLHPEKRKARE